MSQEARLESLSQSQKERLAYIEFKLYFMGEVKRADLTNRFQTAGAAATRDLGLYRDLAPENSIFDGSSKSYRISNKFKPLFEHSLERVISALTQGFGEGLGGPMKSLLPCEVPSVLNRPNLEVLAAITRAINLNRPLSLEYQSLSSGVTVRELVPFALVDSGLRWHVRAYDRKRKSFGDFVLTRMKNPIVLETEVPHEYETAQHDIQWNRIVELELVPHPSKDHPEIIAMDFGMTDNILRVKARAAVVGYLLRRWFVDCSQTHEIDDIACYLWLKDPLALYGVESAKLAPGYTKPGQE
ncbi:WYL domain-containing protein [Aquitalea magnusonii]|uniref:WYL domain-containing protein n=1 Tax=Aquitalea magnusonii TaxID=332411 RepID=UPI000B5CF3BA|nr:WYL domain-containing protein [Aquitalea magnusonii]